MCSQFFFGWSADKFEEEAADQFTCEVLRSERLEGVRRG